MRNRLQELRTERGETQRQMADVMGIKTIGGYCKKELGYNPVTLQEAYVAAVHFGTTIEALFFEEEHSELESPAFHTKSLPPGRREINA